LSALVDRVMCHICITYCDACQVQRTLSRDPGNPAVRHYGAWTLLGITPNNSRCSRCRTIVTLPVYRRSLTCGFKTEPLPASRNHLIVKTTHRQGSRSSVW